MEFRPVGFQAGNNSQEAKTTSTEQVAGYSSRCIRSSDHNAGRAIFLPEVVHIALDCPHG